MTQPQFGDYDDWYERYKRIRSPEPPKRKHKMNHLNILTKVTQALSPEGLTLKQGRHEVKVAYIPSTKQFSLNYKGPHAEHQCTTTVKPPATP